MNLTKNQIVIISVLAVGVIAYYMFFRKKPTTTTKVIITPAPAPAATGLPVPESSWTPDFYGPAQLMNGIGTAGSAGIGGMESSYDDLSAAPTEASLAGIGFNTNWLGY